MKVYGLKNCDSCKKAMKALDSAGATYAFHDVRADGVSKAQIAKWADEAGWERLLNTRSTTWRGLDEDDRSGLNKARAVSLMAVHPTLIKRPVIEDGGGVHVGWTREIEAALLA